MQDFKSPSLRSATLVLALLSAGPVAGQAPVSDPPNLIRAAANPKDPNFGRFPAMTRGRAVQLDWKLLHTTKPGDLRRIEFFKDAVYTARFDKREACAAIAGAFTWQGTLVGQKHSQFVIAFADGAVASWFFAADGRRESFLFEGRPGETYARAYDGSKSVKSSVRAQELVREAAGVCDDNRERIDVAVYYTNTANAQASSSMPAQCLLSMTQANLVLKNSVGPVRLYFATGTPKQITTAADLLAMGTILSRLRNPSDKDMDSVHTDRKSNKADLISLFVADLPTHGKEIGIAYRPATAAQLHPVNGFSVCEWNGVSSYVFIHEIGHNLACGHDHKNASGPSLYNFGYGHNKHFWDNGFPIYNRHYFQTIMSYTPSMSCSFPWVCVSQIMPYFSNPNIIFDFGTSGGKHPAGTSTRNNAESIRRTRQAIANYSRVIAGTNKLRSISVTSTNPSRGVQIVVSSTDVYNKKDGPTPLTRSYCGDRLMTLIAPRYVGNNPFKRWVHNGKPQPNFARTLRFNLDGNETARAEYYQYTKGYFKPFGTGCRGTGNRIPVLTATGQPDINKPIQFRVSNARPSVNGHFQLGFSRTSWNGIPLPLDLTFMGMKGCTLDVSLDIQLGLRTNTSGVWVWNHTVGNSTSYIGIKLYWQASIFDPGVPHHTRIAQSNAVEMLVGGNK